MAGQIITFTDGSTEHWDLLVGADGPHSQVGTIISTPPLLHMHTHATTTQVAHVLLSPCLCRRFPLTVLTSQWPSYVDVSFSSVDVKNSVWRCFAARLSGVLLVHSSGGGSG